MRIESHRRKWLIRMFIAIVVWILFFTFFLSLLYRDVDTLMVSILSTGVIFVIFYFSLLERKLNNFSLSIRVAKVLSTVAFIMYPVSVCGLGFTVGIILLIRAEFLGTISQVIVFYIAMIGLILGLVALLLMYARWHRSVMAIARDEPDALIPSRET